MIKEYIRRAIVALLTLEAKAVLARHRPKVMVVTGSVGKTSTKDAAYTALTPHAFVRKSEKSYNSDIGVPLTILGLPNGWGNPVRWIRNIADGAFLMLVAGPYPAWLIVEVGADRPGDISRALAWLKPDIVVATRFPDVPVHVEFYASPEAVFVEEFFPITQIKSGGAAILNADDPRAAASAVPAGVMRISYAFDTPADFKGSRFRTLSDKGMPRGVSFDVSYHGAHAHISIPDVLGKAHAYAALAGIAAAVSAGASLEEAARNLAHHVPPPGRMRLVKGVRGSIIIDDTYNASPVATEEALRTLSRTPAKGKRIAILADMLELGAHSANEHEKIGRIARECADIVVTAGVRARGMGAEHAFDRGGDAAAFILPLIATGDVVLIKGSQSMRMERAVAVLMHEPARAKELLCRQDAEWLAR